MAVMVGVSPLFHSVDEGGQATEGWMFSVHDGSLWHKDEVPSQVSLISYENFLNLVTT
jgi:hypothetical protein